jgi:hypothetical protein
MIVGVAGILGALLSCRGGRRGCGEREEWTASEVGVGASAVATRVGDGLCCCNVGRRCARVEFCVGLCAAMGFHPRHS